MSKSTNGASLGFEGKLWAAGGEDVPSFKGLKERLLRILQAG